MEHKTHYTAHQQGKSLKNILYVWNGIQQNQNCTTSKLGDSSVEGKKGLTPIKGKGPPGRQRSPGHNADHPPDGEAGSSDMSLTPEEPTLKTRRLTGITINTECQIITITNTIYSQLNFTIMKKHLFILILAVFAANAAVFGQAIGLDQAITSTQQIPALSCVATSLPLHPYPGVPYSYTMDGTTGDEDVDQWFWYVTKDPAFITTGGLNSSTALTAPGDLLAVGTSYNVWSGTNSVTITWSPEILKQTTFQGGTGSSTFVVGYATGVNCSDNIQVYEINPKFNFTVDIASIDATGTLDWGATTSQCVDIVRGATYSQTTKEIDVNYGTNTLYFEIAAANFVSNFTPTFWIEGGLTDDQTADIYLFSSLADAQGGTNTITNGSHSWTSADIGAAGAEWATGLQFEANDPAEVVGGVSLFAKVVITNNTYESLTASTFTLAVDARDNDNLGIWDMEDDDCDTATASNEADEVDQASQGIDPRPTIIMDQTPMGEPSGTDPDDLIIKTTNP